MNLISYLLHLRAFFPLNDKCAYLVSVYTFLKNSQGHLGTYSFYSFISTGAKIGWTIWWIMITIYIAPIMHISKKTPNSNSNTVLRFQTLTLGAVIVPSCNVVITTSSSIKVASCIVIFIIPIFIIK